jgi:dTDP-4-amino-4,6-dideoxygalactose transaminase
VIKIPIIDLKAQYQTIREELRRAIDEVLESQQFILGPTVEIFEQEAASYLGCQEAIGVASGSDALLLSLMALDIGPGDGVAVPPFTFFSTVSAITRLGATPVFVDIDPESCLMSVNQLEALLTKRAGSIKAVIPVHLFGRICPMAEIAAFAAKHRLSIVEDVAQAFGARAPMSDGNEKAAGTIGDLGCFSFFPTKNLGGIGDGGLIATDQAELGGKLRMLRAHGEISKYKHQAVGLNSRLDSIQAAALRVKLRHIDEWCEARIERARVYGKLLFATNGIGNNLVGIPAVVSNRSHVFNYYAIRARRRDELKTYLGKQGIQTEIYYPIPLHLQPCFAPLGYRKGDFPNAEQAADEVLALPLYPELRFEQQEFVVRKIADFYRQ